MGLCPKPAFAMWQRGGKKHPTPLPKRIFPLAVKAKASADFFGKATKKNPSALTGLCVTEAIRL